MTPLSPPRGSSTPGRSPPRVADGWIDIGELLNYTREAVLELSDKAQRPTMPRVEGGDPFRLARVR